MKKILLVEDDPDILESLEITLRLKNYEVATLPGGGGVWRRIQDDPAAGLNLGPRYLDSLDAYSCEIIIKTPGIPASIDAIVRARQAGCVLTSHSQIFLTSYPREQIIGITGTKGKSTTASLIHHIL